VTLVILVGTIAWAAREGRRRGAARRAAGLPWPDYEYLESRARKSLRVVSIGFAGATVGVVVILASSDHGQPTWPLIVALAVLAAGLTSMWLFARVVLPRRRKEQN
jgi:hypothetical protein